MPYGAGITNKQASYLAALCRELRWPYPGAGMTRREASQAIDRARAELERQEKHGRAARAGSASPPGTSSTG